MCAGTSRACLVPVPAALSCWRRPGLVHRMDYVSGKGLGVLGGIHRYDLLILWLLALAAVLVAWLTPSLPLRILLGIPFALVFPGYTALAALSPGEVGPGPLGRLVLSIGLSLMILLLGGLFIREVFLDINEVTVFGYLFLFITVMSVVSWHRRRRFSV